MDKKAHKVYMMALHEEVPEDCQEVFIADYEAFGADGDTGVDEEIRKQFKKLSQEEAERRGDVSGIGARYGYISFEGFGLLVNMGFEECHREVARQPLPPFKPTTGEDDEHCRVHLGNGRGG